MKDISKMVEDHKKEIAKKTLTVKELAEVLQISENKARQLTYAKDFPVIVLGRTRLTVISKLDEWLEITLEKYFKRSLEVQKLDKDLKEMKDRLRQAQQNFNYADDDYIDAAIHELKAVEEKFRAMLRRKRKKERGGEECTTLKSDSILTVLQKLNAEVVKH